jgi:hypothetical protein
MPATRAFSRQLIAYIAAFFPTAPYFKSNDGRVSAVCNDQYSSTLAMLEETADEAFKGCRGRIVKASGLSFDRQFEPYPRAIKAAPVWCSLGCRSESDGRIHQ